MPEIYFSYAWGDPKQGKDSIEYFIDELYNSLKADGYLVKRDKMDMSYGDLISEFMREIGEADLVVIGISDKYLRSHYCMWELCEIYRNSSKDPQKFTPKLLPIRIENIDFNDLQVQRKYVEFWDKEFKDINQFITDLPDQSGITLSHKKEKIRTIRHDFINVTAYINDINSLTKALLQENDFESIKNKINSRVRIKPYKANELKSKKIGWNEIDKDILSTLYGDWDTQTNVTIFNKGHHVETPVGVILGPTIFYESEIEVDVVFNKLKDMSDDVLDTSAKILFNYNTDDGSYYCIGIGGYSYKYSIVEFKKNNDQWEWAPIRTSGDRRSLKENHTYKLRTRISNSNIELFENNVLIFKYEITVQKDLQIGLFAWGTNPIEFTNFRYKTVDIKKSNVVGNNKFSASLGSWFKRYSNTIIGSITVITAVILFTIFGNKLSCNGSQTIPEVTKYNRIELKLDLSDSLFNIYKDSLSFSFKDDSNLFISKRDVNKYLFDSIVTSIYGQDHVITTHLNNRVFYSNRVKIDSISTMYSLNDSIKRYDIKKIKLLDNDSDGIPDTYDKCPKIKGSLINDGCPVNDPFIHVQSADYGGILWQMFNGNNRNMGIYHRDNLDNQNNRFSKYGKLFSYNQAVQYCSSLPGGWRLPKDTEFRNLVNLYGGFNKNEINEISLNPNSNAFGDLMQWPFNFTLGGTHNKNEIGSLNPNNFGSVGYYWTSDSINDKKIIIFLSNSFISRRLEDKENYFSCRCVKELNDIKHWFLELPNFTAGDYELRIKIEGKTFNYKFNHDGKSIQKVYMKFLVKNAFLIQLFNNTGNKKWEKSDIITNGKKFIVRQ